ncbi:small integral membrane protein 14-like [Clytia hemisphaerica]|uniref:Small integral membrane protein 14 n=1 Tax=Clytia hemisphaerica TaxID=252671 RepID=A0A7M5UPN4_9CNID|eukprot:TCONS_00058459-protein
MGEPPPFDPCECIFSPAGAMRRLISLLRQSQNYCTDDQCFGNPPGPNQNEDTGMTMFMMFIAWVVVAAALYLFRPTSVRDGSKPARHDNNDDHPDRNDPHNPPPVM